VSPTAITPEHFPWFDYRRYTFSLGLRLGDEVVLSGHSASQYDPDEGRIVVRGGMAEQTATAYDKIEAILAAEGFDLGDAVRVVENVTVAGIDHYAEAEEVRAARLGGNRPAVVTLCVDRLLRPAALIEIAVVAQKGAGDPLAVSSAAARPAFVPARPAADGVVYLSSVLPVDDHGAVVGDDLESQTEAVFDRAGRMLAAAGLGWDAVVHTVDYTTPGTLRDYKRTGRIRAERLSAPYPGAAGILMSRLAHPDALIQLDIIASTEPAEAVNPGWERYGKLTYSPAVRAGNVLFMSGQAALDPETERAVHAGDVAAQAEYTYGNIIAVLEAAGGGPEHLVETVEHVTPAGLDRYREVAAVRERLLRSPWPASTGIVCRGLLRPEFEIEVIPLAILPETPETSDG
jgi:enamine deaminase RidA (YjgF/YER057c/UK114 family)